MNASNTPQERIVDRVVHLPAPAKTTAPSPARVIEVVKSGEGVIRESTEPLIYRDGIPRESLNMSQPIAQRFVPCPMVRGLWWYQ